MVTYLEAREQVLAYLKESNDVRHHQNPLVLLDNHTIVKDYGWVFFYQAWLFLRTGNFNYALLGNSPILVLKKDGSHHFLGTAVSTEYNLKRLEKELNLK